MATDNHAERDEQADRLKKARVAAGFGSVREAADALGVNLETYKAHETGRNGFSINDAKKYARRFRVPVAWLVIGDDDASAVPTEEETLTILEAKRRLALSLGLDPKAIKIIIEA
jgi:DNA-binding XRE family transcriptional regulator